MEYRQQPQRHQSGRYRKKKTNEWPHIILFYILPFLVFNSILFYLVIASPKISLSVAETTDYMTTDVTLKIESWYPVKSVTMAIDGEPVELTKGKGRIYTTKVYQNGSIEANVVNLNGMPAMATDHIRVIDENPPTFEDAKLEDGILTVQLSDSQSGVNFDSIYAVNSAGEQLEATMLNPEINAKAFVLDPAGTQVFAQDIAGNEVQQFFSSHKEGETGVLDSGAEEQTQAEGSESV